MGFILLNLQSNQEITLDKGTPFVIGRGPLTGCADKRVSRSHGRITCTADGKINLQALHSNPCFFTKKGIPPVKQLNKNEEEVLIEGDCLGLLPNSYWYQIISKSRAKEKKQNGIKPPQVAVHKAEAIPKVEVVDLEENNGRSQPLEHPPSSENEINNPGNHETATASGSGGNSNTCIPFRLRETCRLPIWMYEVKGQRDFEQLQIKKEVFHAIMSNSGIGTGSAPDSASNSTATDKTKNNNPDERKDHADDTRPKPGRPYCQYDANCYRKNAQHKLEYSHPGDADYVPYENRPMCEYGANCYRRNLSHRRQFRHGSNDDPQTSQAPEAPNTSAAAGGSTQGGPANMRPRGNGDPQKRRHKRKRRFDSDRTTRSCHLSVTVSASPKQKRRRNSYTGENQSALYASDASYDDSASSQDPFSDDYSSDDYIPTDDSGDDVDEFQYYSKDFYY